MSPIIIFFVGIASVVFAKVMAAKNHAMERDSEDDDPPDDDQEERKSDFPPARTR